ncbi:hypothetical protein [Phyllobacterium sp. P30BS-XVII]|uniref:hypothetical protein n=1 Tax=Phyllobacterium sp. P30BS-XVII TaxID=2587046 RepID=UPI000DD786C5|nr:hypothetical protein [Phyllobacterium sp. P30BS-XVII]MBA8900120.1 hypothetical protein [Phyllobacterium sp. P30BS-XVII]
MKSWAEKLNASGPFEVKPVPVNIAGMKAGEIMLVPTPRLVDDFIRTLPKGRHMDVKTLRQAMAKQHGAEVTCPITLGFHLRTVAEAAFEDYQRTGDICSVTPFWRVLDSSTSTVSRLSFGAAFVTEQRLNEGLKE